MRDNTFSKKVFIKTVSDNLKNKYRKTIDDATAGTLSGCIRGRKGCHHG